MTSLPKLSQTTPYQQVRFRIRELRRTYGIRNARYWRSAWVNGPDVSRQDPVIIGGCDRSGTTLLRAILDSHPNLAIGPEAWVFAYRPKPDFLADEYGLDEKTVQSWLDGAGSLAQFAERFFGDYRDRVGKTRWGEKSPANILHLDYVTKYFPRARILHIVRDPRDTVCSLRKHPKRIRVGDTYVPNEVTRPTGECIRWWNRYVGAGIKWRGHPAYLELRYEDLVASPEAELRRIMQHIGEDWDDVLLEHSRKQQEHPVIGTEIVNHEVRGAINASAVGRWERDLTGAQIARIERETDGLRRALGYV